MEKEKKKLPGVIIRSFPTNQVLIQSKISLSIADTLRLLDTKSQFRKEFQELFDESLKDALKQVEKSRNECIS